MPAARTIFRGPSALGHFEPELRITPLRRCPGCLQPHPRARKPALDTDTCPDCDILCETGPTQIETAAFGGPWGFVANIFLATARWLTNFARSI